jgi:hypothetical protein
MQINSAEVGVAQVLLTAEEVLTVNNALNEVCHALDVPEFSTRMGVSVEDATALLRQFHDLYGRLSRS